MAARSIVGLWNVLDFHVNHIGVGRRSFNKYVRITSMEFKKRQKQFLEEMKPEKRIELQKRNNFIEWNYDCEIYAFGKRLHEDFKKQLLTQAFTHKSYIIKEKQKLLDIGIENPEINLKDNDDLAENGEKIMLNYIPKYLSYFFPRLPLEGINGTKDFLMSDEVLADVSKNLGTTFLILSADFPVEPSTYSKTLKAIVGALSESQNVNRANLFVRDFVVTQLAGKDVNDYLQINQPLDTLNEILKKDGKEACEPRIICKSAVNTILANYHIGLYSSRQLVGHSSGENIDIAIEMAARDALKRLFHTTDSCSPVTYNLEKVPESVANVGLNEWSSEAFNKKSKSLSA